MVDKTLVNFEMFKKTHDLSKAEQEQRLYNWSVKVVTDFLKDGKIDDAYDIVAAGLLIKQHGTTDYERKTWSSILSDVGKNGYETEVEEIKWRLQKYLKLDGDK